MGFFLSKIVQRSLVNLFKLLIKSWHMNDPYQTGCAAKGIVAEFPGHFLWGQLRNCGCEGEGRLGGGRGGVEVRETTGSSIGSLKERGLCCGRAHHSSKMVLHPSQEDGTGGNTMEIPATPIINVKLSNGIDHRGEMGIINIWLLR